MVVVVFVLLVVVFRFWLLYCLSHHLQGRVDDSDSMEGYDSDSTVGPGYFSSTRRGCLCFALPWSQFVFFRSIFCFSALALSPYSPFPSVCLFILYFSLIHLHFTLFYIFVFLCLSLLSFSVSGYLAYLCYACHSPAQ